MFRPTFLYVKTHNITGLKYFGKTVAVNPSKYRGSGKYWRNHIRKYGYDVTTEILGFFTDESLCKNFALQFSEEHDIVNSKLWANLKVESLDGGFDYINLNGLSSKQFTKGHSTWNKGISTGPNSIESNERRSKTLKEKWKHETHYNKGRTGWLAGKKGMGLITAWNKDKIMPKNPCPHCNKEVDALNMKRWHGDNCKIRLMS